LRPSTLPRTKNQKEHPQFPPGTVALTTARSILALLLLLPPPSSSVYSPLVYPLDSNSTQPLPVANFPQSDRLAFHACKPLLPPPPAITPHPRSLYSLLSLLPYSFHSCFDSWVVDRHSSPVASTCRSATTIRALERLPPAARFATKGEGRRTCTDRIQPFAAILILRRIALETRQSLHSNHGAPPIRSRRSHVLAPSARSPTHPPTSTSQTSQISRSCGASLETCIPAYSPNRYEAVLSIAHIGGHALVLDVGTYTKTLFAALSFTSNSRDTTNTLYTSPVLIQLGEITPLLL